MTRQDLVPHEWLSDRTRSASSSGAGLPPYPRDGQMHFVREGSMDGEWFYYDATKDKWLSNSTYNVDGVFLAVTAPTMLWVDYLNAANVKFGANIGYRAPYDLELMSIGVQCSATATATFQLFVNNAAHAGSTLALAAVTGNQGDAYTSATIAQGSYLGAGCTAVTGAASGTIKMTFKRVVA